MIIQNLKVLTKTLKNKGKKNYKFYKHNGKSSWGHLSLIRKSQKRGHFSLVSIYVNPLQFSEKNDFKNIQEH